MILLPTWKVLLEKLELAALIMPHDVKTRWNSTYDMLAFTLEYKEAIKELTSDKSNGLCSFELNDDERELVEELTHILKVHCFMLSLTTSHSHSLMSFTHTLLIASHIFFNYSFHSPSLFSTWKMVPSFSHVTHPISRRSYPLWTKSMSISPTTSMTTHWMWRFEPQLFWPR